MKDVHDLEVGEALEAHERVLVEAVVELQDRLHVSPEVVERAPARALDLSDGLERVVVHPMTWGFDAASAKHRVSRAALVISWAPSKSFTTLTGDVS